MPRLDRIREYSIAVCGQIRWKKSHAVVAEEIANHLADQRDAYMTDGADEAAATEAAIAQMGDPVAVGALLDRTHRPRPQWGMLALAVLLACSGALIQIFFELNVGSYLDSDTVHLLIYVPFALALMIIVYFLDFSIISRHPLWFYILPMAWLAINFIIFLIKKNASDLLFYTGIVPLLTQLGYVGFVYAMRNKGYWGLAASVAALLLPAVIMLNLSSLSEVLLFAVSSLAILCVAISRGWLGVKKRNAFLLVLTPVAAALLFALVYILVSGQTWEQIMTALGSYYKDDISADIRTLLANSRLIGPGSISEIPLAHSLDPLMGYNIFFVLTYLIFDIGWIPVMLLLSLLIVFIVMGFARCFRQKSVLGLLVSLSVMLTLTMQSVSYVLPNLGLNLYLPWSMPFLLDFGYTSCVNMALVGLMLSVFRTGDIVRDRLVKNHRLMHTAQS